MVAGHVQQIAAAVFELAVADIGPDDALDDIGMDSLMAMDFRLRVNAMFTVDLPLLELLRGVSVNSLADRILADLHLTGAWPAAVNDEVAEAADDDVDRLIEELSETELREVLAELEKPTAEATRDFRGARSEFVEILWATAGRAGGGPRCGIRRSFRDPRAQRCRQINDHRDPRGSSKA